jgi:hypothetical protein
MNGTAISKRIANLDHILKPDAEIEYILVWESDSA